MIKDKIDFKNLPKKLMEDEKKRQDNLDDDYEDLGLQQELLRKLRLEKITLMANLRLVNMRLLGSNGSPDPKGLQIKKNIEDNISALEKIIKLTANQIEKLAKDL